MGFKEDQGIKYYQFDIFRDQPFFHALLTRHGGYSSSPFDSLNTGGTVGDNPQDVLKNHQKIFEVFGFDYYSRFDVWQVHGTKIICADSPRVPETPHEKADGILTNMQNVTLFMRFADCVPILIYDPENQVIGIVHAGWQGTAHRIVQAAVEKMVNCYQSLPGSLIVGIGPSICMDCYEVGDDVYRVFHENFGEDADRFFRTALGKRHLDLCAVNFEILRDAGVNKIENANICNSCHPVDWYSHRGQNGRTGRYGVIMSLNQPKEDRREN